MKNRVSTPYQLVIISFLFLSLIATLQLKDDSYLPPFSTRWETVRRNLLPATLLPYIDFGFTRVLADYYWIRSVQDYVAWDERDTFYFDYLRNISTLDPAFKYPYLFNIFAVPKDIQSLDIVAENAKRGMEAIPTSWEIPYYLGTRYYLFTKKTVPAVAYLEQAAKIPGAPSGVYLNYASFVAKGDDGETAKNLFKTIYDSTDDETIKKVAGLGIAQETIRQMLTKGIAAYKTRYGKNPRSIEDLEQERFISLPQELKDLFEIEINQSNGSFRIRER